MEFTKTFIFSSDPNNGAENLRDNGSRFNVTYDAPVSLPSNAHTATLEVVAANIWWTTPNISAELGNNVFRYETATKGVVDLIFPDGLYDLDHFNDHLSRHFVATGLPANEIVFSPFGATQHTVATFKNNGSRIHFDHLPGINVLLGFDPVLIPVGGVSTAGQSVEGANEAKFNSVSSFLIHGDIVTDGIAINNQSSYVLTQVPIDVTPGAQIVYRPRQPIPVDAGLLIGSQRNSFEFWLTSQDGTAADTQGEYWDFLCVIRYIV